MKGWPASGDDEAAASCLRRRGTARYWRHPPAQKIPPCLSAAALTLLAGASNGNPRLLNLLARAAWIEAAQAGANTIAPEHVQYALNVVPIAHDKIDF